MPIVVASIKPTTNLSSIIFEKYKAARPGMRLDSEYAQHARDLLLIEACAARKKWRKNETLKVEHNLCTFHSTLTES